MRRLPSETVILINSNVGKMSALRTKQHSPAADICDEEGGL
jgi:hypothetical protein